VIKNLMIGSILLAISAGCAVDAPDEPQVSTIDDEIVVQCGPINFREEFFAEAAMINLVGTRSCTCFGTVRFTGTITEFGRLHHKFTCDIR
jgi:hypothetical protein